MPTFIQTPHLPEKNISLLVTGKRYEKLLADCLSKLNIETLWMPENKKVDPRLSSHVDLSLIHLGTNRIIASKDMIEEELFVNNLTNRGIQVLLTNEEVGLNYPDDAVLNVCIIGHYLFGNDKIYDSSIHNYRPDLKSIHVNQGYTKCSICVVDEKALITADKSISDKAAALGFDVQLISPGYIELAGFDTGFIGGSAFKTSKNKIAFTGHLNNHPDENKILSFLERHEIDPIFLTNEPIFDIGSAIPLFEG